MKALSVSAPSLSSQTRDLSSFKKSSMPEIIKRIESGDSQAVSTKSQAVSTSSSRTQSTINEKCEKISSVKNSKSKDVGTNYSNNDIISKIIYFIQSYKNYISYFILYCSSLTLILLANASKIFSVAQIFML